MTTATRLAHLEKQAAQQRCAMLDSFARSLCASDPKLFAGTWVMEAVRQTLEEMQTAPDRAGTTMAEDGEYIRAHMLQFVAMSDEELEAFIVQREPSFAEVLQRERQEQREYEVACQRNQEARRAAAAHYAALRGREG